MFECHYRLATVQYTTQGDSVGSHCIAERVTDKLTLRHGCDVMLCKDDYFQHSIGKKYLVVRAYTTLLYGVSISGATLSTSPLQLSSPSPS